MKQTVAIEPNPRLFPAKIFCGAKYASIWPRKPPNFNTTQVSNLEKLT